MGGEGERVDSPGEAATIDAASGEPNDSFDEILKRVVTGDPKRTIASGTVIANRFRIEKLIGAGGMGSVYVARDQTLGRDVAIKLHHAAYGGVRLRREAIAMARLAHPNVVTVFEVGELDGHPFVVMEFVTGTTLRAWLAEKPRTVIEILDMLIAAGEGLAAAHDAGLVHRDIKPENVLVGSDGRARVGDFGLARELDSVEETPAPRPDALLTPMTQTGAVLGTPAYMAPEQFTGAPIDARADQFAFCITVWEALWKERPFAGATIDALHAALTSGVRRPPPAKPKVPARIRAALERGLSTNPEDRHASMHALLAALRAPLRLRRRALIGGVGGAGVGALGVVAYLALGHHDEPISCADAGVALAAMVPRDLPARLTALGTPGAIDAATRVSTAVDKLTAQLTRGARTTCEAGRARHEWSPELVAKSDSCLDVAARTARALLTFDTLTVTQVPELVRRATSSLPDVQGCTSPTFLAVSPPVPDDRAELEALITARVDLARAHADLEDRHLDRAQTFLDRIAASTVRDVPRIAAGLLVARSVLAANRELAADAEKLATDGYYAARALDDDETTTFALSNLLSLASQRSGDDPMLQMWMRTAIADAERFAPRAPWLAAILYLNAANLADAVNDAPSALRYIARFRSLAGKGDRINLRGDLVEAAVLIWSGKTEQGIAEYERAIAAEIELLGADHPRVGVDLSDYAASLLSVNRLEAALAVARRAEAILAKSVDPGDDSLDAVRDNLGAVLSSAGHNDEARPLYETARAHYVAHYGVHSTYVAHIDMNLASMLLDDKKFEAAQHLLEEALATDEQVIGPDRIEVAEVLFNLAVARRGRGDLPGAMIAAKRCLAIYTAKSPGSDRQGLVLGQVAEIANDQRDYAAVLELTATAVPASPESPTIAAMLQLQRARALIGLHRASEARPLLAAARAAYAAVPLPDRVAEIDRLTPQTR